MDRRENRETAFKILFEADFKPDEMTDELFSSYCAEWGIESPDDYLCRIVRDVWEKRMLLDETIERNSNGWKLNRISRVSKTIMRIAVTEMLDETLEVPAAAAINEAVELTKMYDDEAAPKFVNGVLNSVMKELA